MKNELVILSNDPSITAWGYAVVTVSGEVLETGCIKTAPDNTKKNIRKADDRIRRISEINRTLLQAIKKHNVGYILSEAPHGSQSAVAAIMIGMVSGMAQTMSDCLEIPVEFHPEGDVKKYVLGKRSAAKDEMIQAMKRDIGFDPCGTKYIDEAVADALGVYMTAIGTSEALKLAKKLKS